MLSSSCGTNVAWVFFVAEPVLQRFHEKQRAEASGVPHVKGKLGPLRKGDLDEGGFFCVGHKAEFDRLIHDSWLRNRKDVKFGWARLPCGPQFSQVVFEPHEFLRASTDDLRTYFYTLSQLQH